MLDSPDADSLSPTSINETRRSDATERAATKAGFFLFGFFLSAWAPLAPLAKLRLQLSDAAFGYSLLCFGVGSIAAMPVGTAIAARIGCRRTILFAVPLASACLPFLSCTRSSVLLAFTLLLFGAGLGATESAMNIQAALIQRRHQAPLMSGFHAFFSVGCIAGAGGVSAMLWLGASALQSVVPVLVVVTAILLRHARHFLPYGSPRGASGFAWPRGLVLIIGGLCFITFLAEGAMLDWSGVFLVTVKKVAAEHSGWGYAVFAIAMTTGRLSGDRMMARFDARKVLGAGALAAAVGLVVAVAASSWLAALAAFALAGFGLANIVPVLYLSVARQHSMPLALAMPAVATIGYAGMLAGPALIGSIAQATSLSVAFTSIAALLLIVAASAKVAQ